MINYFAVSTLRELSSLELHQLYKLRVDVFVHEQATPYAEIDDVDALDTTFHVQAWRRDADSPARLTGCARLYPTDDAVRIGRLVVAEDARGAGLGAELLLQTMRLAAERFPGRTVALDAQEHLADFYAGFGFRPAGAVHDDTGVAHLPMQIDPQALAATLKNWAGAAA